MELSRCSLNHGTIYNYSLREMADVCARWNIPCVGLMRSKVAETGLKESVRIIKQHSLKVSGLVRGSIFPLDTKAERLTIKEDNYRAIDEAVELGCDVLSMVAGPPFGCDLSTALNIFGKDLKANRSKIEEILNDLIPYAKSAGVKIGLEPLHPMFAADRSMLVMLEQTNNIIAKLNSPELGLIIDTYHVWWDPNLFKEIKRARGKIVGFHVNDWIVPFRHDLMSSRGMMGDGSIDIKRISRAVEEAGYNGPVEIEVFNKDVWNEPIDDVIKLATERFSSFV